jgi:hypothetical protein
MVGEGQVDHRPIATRASQCRKQGTFSPLLALQAGSASTPVVFTDTASHGT